MSTVPDDWMSALHSQAGTDVTDPWGIPAYLYRPGPGRPLYARRSRELLTELAHIRRCGCTCHAGRDPHFGMACECGPTSTWAARLGVSSDALGKAERRARRRAA